MRGRTLKIADSCRALLGALATAGMMVACAPKPASPVAIQAAMGRCMDDQFLHLMSVAFAGAVDPDYAEQAKAAARTCKGAIADLKRLKAPEACISHAQDIEALQWKLSRVLDGQTDDTWMIGLGASEGLAEACAQAANFPKPPPNPEADSARLAAETAAREAEKATAEATAAAAAAQKAALEAMGHATK